MTTALAVVPEPEDERDLSTLSLRELGVLANREFASVLDSFRRTVEQMIACGEILIAARQLLKDGEWGEWLDNNFGGARDTAWKYMRAAHYRSEISEAPNIAMAEEALRGLPSLRRPAYGRDEAKRLRGEGLTYGRIADALGTSEGRAWELVNGEAHFVRRRERAKERLKAKKALAAQEREREIRAAVKSSGKGVSKLYASLERMQDELAEARDEVDGLDDVQTLFHRLRDEFVSKALGVS